MNKEKIIKFYSKHRIYIFPTIVVLSSLFLIAFAIIPQTMKLMDNQKAIGILTDRSNFLEAKAQTLESFDEEDLSKKIEVAMAAFPADKDFGNILGVMQKIAAESEFIIKSISISNAKGKVANAESYIIRVDLQGVKALFSTLINKLENSPRLVRIDSMDTQANQVSQSFNVNMEIEVLYSQPSKNLGAVDSPLPVINEKDEEILATLARMSTTEIPQTIGIQSPRGKSNPFE